MEEPTVQEQTSPEQPFFKKRGAKKSAIRKRPATPPPEASDSDSSGYTSTEDEGRRIKRRKKSAIVTASSNNTSKSVPTQDLTTTTFAADRTAQILDTNDATKQSNWYDERSLLGSTRKPPKQPPSKTLTTQPTDNGNYKGLTAHTSFITKNPNAPPKTVGPVKAPTNIRTITVTDFAPDVCKDYKQTGFCGFGDSCKFLHERQDYKQGWELDKDWEIGSKNKSHKGRGQTTKDRQSGEQIDDDEEDDEALLESIPFACVICKKGYTNPIVTKCGHYFCESCALGRYRKQPGCAVCGEGTGGVFNGAKSLKRLLERKRERGRARREKAREEGGEVGEEDEEEEEDEGE